MDALHLSVVAALVGVMGAALGSFFNVVAYRLPRGESLVRPPSRCPGCETAIKPYDNVPVLGWLALRGRCRTCGSGISARYPIVEAATAVLAVAVFVAARSGPRVYLGEALLAVLVPIALIDFDHQIIPNRITGPAALAALALGVILQPSGVVGQVEAGLAAAGFLGVFAVAYPRGMGMGDVKLAGVLGLYLGASVAVGLFVAVLTGTIVGAGVMARVGARRGRRVKLPFGPFLAFGALVAQLVGPAVLHWYLHAGL
jgi:leader peptidase (prepilin peptidase)/N-methyltransferase